MHTYTKLLRHLAFSAVAVLTCVFSTHNVQAQNIAIVNGQPIPKAHMDMILRNLKQEASQQGQKLPPDIEQNVREHLIQRTINIQQAKSLKLHLSPEYAQKLEDVRAAILTQLLFEHYKKQHPISDNAARIEYKRIVKELSANAQKEYSARHILVKTKAQAQKILAQLRSGADFSKLAKTHSNDPGSAAQGGKLQWSTADNYVPKFAAALENLNKGQTTKKPIKTGFGYHIIKLEDTRTKQPPPFDLVKEQIKQKMQQPLSETFQKYLRKLRKTARIR